MDRPRWKNMKMTTVTVGIALRVPERRGQRAPAGGVSALANGEEPHQGVELIVRRQQ